MGKEYQNTSLSGGRLRARNVRGEEHHETNKFREVHAVVIEGHEAALAFLQDAPPNRLIEILLREAFPRELK